LEPEKLDCNKKISEIDEWDSFNNLMLIAEVEKCFCCKYTAQELGKIVTVNQIVESIKAKIK